MTKKDNELVSVVMPTYNRSNLIKRAIDSVLNQSYSNLELIIVDDNSEDNTEALIKDIKDERIRYYKNASNLHKSRSINKALEFCNGKYFTSIDDDDEFTINRLQVLKSFFDEKYSFSCSAITKVRNGKSEYKFWKKELVSADLKIHNKAFNQVFTLRKRIIDIGGYDEKLTSCIDQDLNYRLIKQYGTAICSPKATQNIYQETTRARISLNSIDGKKQFFAKHKIDFTTLEKSIYMLKIWKFSIKIFLERRTNG